MGEAVLAIFDPSVKLCVKKDHYRVGGVVLFFETAKAGVLLPIMDWNVSLLAI
jgi:hypothetical protein